MDPLSVTANIGSLCALTVKLISTISEFIDSVQQAPTEVQSLSNELASLYASFGHIRVAVQAAKPFDLPDKWKDNFDRLMLDCESTLGEVHVLVAKAKITETQGSVKLVWKSVKFVFKEKQVEFLRRRIVAQNGILQNLLGALAESREVRIERRLEVIQSKVEELVATRAKVREVLVVLEKEDEGADQADFTLNDRRRSQVPGRNIDGNNEEGRLDHLSPASSNSAPTNVPALSEVLNDVVAVTRPSVQEQKALDTIQTKIWTLQGYREREAGQYNWSNDLRADDRFMDCQHLRFKLSVDSADEVLALRFVGDNDHRGVNPFPEYRRWIDARTTLHGSTLTTHLRGYAEDTEQKFWKFEDEFTFHTAQDAQEFQSCFTSMCGLLKTIRKIQVAAALNINPHIAFVTPQEVSKAAYWFGYRDTSLSCAVM